MTMYELTGEYLMLMQMAEEDDIDTGIIADTMEGVEGEIEDKAEQLAIIRQQLIGEAEMLEKEEKRLASKRKTIEGNADAIKRNIEAAMYATGKKKFKTAHFSFGIQKNGGLAPLEIDGDISDIPQDYLIEHDPTPDNAKIRELLKTQKVPWAHLGERGESLRIK